MRNEITAQALYDWREATSVCSGETLHALFEELFDGEPSPPGAWPVPMDRLHRLAERHADTAVGAAARAFLA